jgi:tRNA C32,U32 (ribose-2'-O)-methylase TrmJ
MSDSTIESQAPTPEQEIAQIEKAIGDKTESAKPTEEQEQVKTAFDELAEVKNFKSVDDLVDAYKNLESKMNPTMKELKDLRVMVESIQESTKPEVRDPFEDLPQEQREAIGLLDKLLDRQLNTKLSPLLKKAEVEEAKQKITTVRKQFPGVNDEELNQAISIMEKYPQMELEEAVKIASYDRASRSASASSKRTETEMQNKRAFAESASTARQGDDTNYSKMNLKELEEILNIPSNARLY